MHLLLILSSAQFTLSSDFFQVRECAYKLYLHEDYEQKQHLDHLLIARYMLAQLVGFDTYAHRAIRGTMAETPGIFHVK